MLTVKNAAIEFGNKARELGHKLNSTNGVTKNSKNNTSDDKTMLRGFFRTEKKITEEGKTYNKYPDPPKLWSEQHREPPIYADWLNKKSRASTGTDISPTPANKYVPFLKGTSITSIFDTRRYCSRLLRQQIKCPRHRASSDWSRRR